MKIAQFSDLHYCEKYLQWVHKAFSAGVDHAIAVRAEVGIISGDSFDREILLHHPAVGFLSYNIRRLADHMPVLIIQGTFSHDRPGCLDVFKHLKAKFPVYVADKPGQVALATGRQWKDDFSDPPLTAADWAGTMDNASLLVSVLPSVNRADIQADNPEAKTSEILDGIFARWAPSNLEARARGIPTVLVSHGTVNGCVTESKQAMVSPDHEFGTAALFSAQTSAVMLGHIHAHQSWEYEGRRIAYAGSITKLIYGHDQPTGCILWEVEPASSTIEFVPLPARNLVDIQFDGPPDMALLQARLANCRDAYVRLRYVVDEEHRGAVDTSAIKDLLKAAGCADFKVEPRVNPVQRTRAAGISKAVTVEERLRQWCTLTGSDPGPLVDRLHQLGAT